MALFGVLNDPTPAQLPLLVAWLDKSDGWLLWLRLFGRMLMSRQLGGDQRNGDDRLSALTRGRLELQLSAESGDHVSRQEQPESNSTARLLGREKKDRRRARALRPSCPARSR